MEQKDFLLYFGGLAGIILVASGLSFATGNAVASSRNIPKEILTASTTENQICIDLDIPKNLIKTGKRYSNNLIRERSDFVATGRTDSPFGSYDSDTDTIMETPQRFIEGAGLTFTESGTNLVATECLDFSTYLNMGFSDIYFDLELTILNPTNKVLAYGGMGVNCHKDTNTCSVNPIKWQEFSSLTQSKGKAKAKESLELIK